MIYFGSTAESVVSPTTGAPHVNGGSSFASDNPLSSVFPVTGLQPAKTYYFSVLGYYTQNGQEIEATRSAASFATKTEVSMCALAGDHVLVAICVSPISPQSVVCLL